MATGDLIASINTTGSTVKAYQFQGFSSTVRTSFTTTSAFFGPSWLTSGGNVIFGNANPTTSVKQGTGFSATVTSSFAWPDAATLLGDSHWDDVGVNLYAQQYGQTKSYRFTGFSSTIGASLTLANASRGVAWNSTDSKLIVMVQGASGRAVRMTGYNTTVDTSVTISNFYGGLTWDRDNSNLWVEVENGATYPEFKKMSGFSATVLASFNKGSNANYFGLHYEVDSAAGPANVKTWLGLAKASVKTVEGLAIASVKTANGLN